MRRKISIIGISGLLILVLATGSSWAVPFDLVGVNYPTLGAHVEFTYGSSITSEGTVTVVITNTSTVPTGEDPMLTGFLFNAPASLSLSSSIAFIPGWTTDSVQNGFNTLGQYGLFDVAALTGSDFNGGMPNSGIPISGSAEFSFTFTSISQNMTLLSEADFLGLLSAPENGQTTPQYFIARFQQVGPGGEGSDVAIPGTSSVPEPGTLLLLGVGLVGIAGIGRKKRV